MGNGKFTKGEDEDDYGKSFEELKGKPWRCQSSHLPTSFTKRRPKVVLVS